MPTFQDSTWVYALINSWWWLMWQKRAGDSIITFPLLIAVSVQTRNKSWCWVPGKQHGCVFRGANLAGKRTTSFCATILRQSENRGDGRGGGLFASLLERAGFRTAPVWTEQPTSTFRFKLFSAVFSFSCRTETTGAYCHHYTHYSLYSIV